MFLTQIVNKKFYLLAKFFDLLLWFNYSELLWNNLNCILGLKDLLDKSEQVLIYW